jgi:hypothetical protein
VGGAEVVGPAAEGIVESELDQDLALFHPGTSQVVVLNATAADVWRLSDGEHSLDGLVALLAQAYGVAGASIRHDVEATVALLRLHGFIAAPAE